MEILGERLETQSSANLNVSADYPESIVPISYFAVFAGIGLVAIGVRVGIGSAPSSGET